MRFKKKLKKLIEKIRDPDRPLSKRLFSRTQRREWHRAKLIGFGNLWRVWRRGNNKHVFVDSKVMQYTEDLTNMRFKESTLNMRKASESMHMSELQIDITEAQFLKFLVHTVGAYRILEVGTFRGWSTAVLAEALLEAELEQGPLFKQRCFDYSNRLNDDADHSTQDDSAKIPQVTTIELRPEEAIEAKALWDENLDQMTLSRIKMIQGDGVSVMKSLIGKSSFDIIFIDADKSQYGNYFLLAKQLVSAGGLIVLDNALNAGLVATNSKDRSSLSLRQVNLDIFNSPDISFEPMIIPAWDGVVVLRCKF